MYKQTKKRLVVKEAFEEIPLGSRRPDHVWVPKAEGVISSRLGYFIKGCRSLSKTWPPLSVTPT